MSKSAVPVVAILVAALLGSACASTRKSESEREWEKAECRQIIDGEARSKCLERVDKE